MPCERGEDDLHCGLLERTTAKDGKDSQQCTQPVRKVGVAYLWEE